MKKVIMTILMVAFVLTILAVPAKRGTWTVLTLADGSKVNATLVGDEHGHYWKGDNGRAYVMTGSEGVCTEVDAQQVRVRAARVRNVANKRRAARRVGGTMSHYTGEKKGIIILANYQDVKMNTAHNQTLFSRIANEEGFAEGKFRGSIADYFKAQSRGKFLLDFDVYGPVTVSRNQNYYGENDSEGNDKHAAELIIEAVNAVMNQVEDWSQYDWDGDGYVDQVYVIYAGKGEADGGIANTIWPHEYALSAAHYYGDGTGPVTVATGLKVDTYACGSELDGSGNLMGIGTICHEFSHCLGYPDYYDTDYSGGQGMGYWDLMDSGSYNGDGFVPAGYTSYERWVAGWDTPIVLADEDVEVRNMPDLQSSGSSYVIYNKAHEDEFYLLENRQKVGWDAALPGDGLLILHVDYDENIWAANTPNDDPARQRMTWIPADNDYQYFTYMGEKYYTETGMATDTYPYGPKNAFNADTKPAALFANRGVGGSKYMDGSVETITRHEDGTVSFDYVAQYEGKINNGGLVFYESYNECSGIGGNDGQWHSLVASQKTDYHTDNVGWTAATAYGGFQCAKYGSSKTVGVVTSPEISFTQSSSTLTFRAAAFVSDGTTLQVTVQGDGLSITPSSFAMKGSEWTDFTATISGTGVGRLVFTPVKRFFLDEVLVTVPSTTGIQAVKDAQQSDALVYTLDGRCLGSNKQSLKPGLYIVGKRKVVIR